jgi:hypothetical protein
MYFIGIFIPKDVAMPNLVKAHAGATQFKGTVRRDATGAENRLKRSVLTNYMTASLNFFILKRHHHEKSKKPVSAS